MTDAPENLVWETCTTTGTPHTLTAVAQSFNTAFGTGGTDKFDIFMRNRDAAGEWMYATGHLSAAATLVIDTVIEGSNGASEPSWSAGTKDVWNDIPAAEQFRTTATAKTTPVDADSVPLVDSAASSVAKIVTWSNIKAALKTYLDTLYTAIGGREVLTGNRTYYVRDDGNDSNDGLTNSSGGAFLTIGAALTPAAALDCSTYDVTIQVVNVSSPSTYAEAVTLPKLLGSGTFTLLGDTTTPSNVVISATSANAITASNCGRWTIAGVTLTTTTSGFGIFAFGGETSLTLTKVFFGTMGGSYYHLYVSASAYVNITADYSIVGNAYYHWRVEGNGYLLVNSGLTITLTGTPAFNTFVYAHLGGMVSAQSETFSGSATGVRFHARMNSAIYTNGATAASYFPGNSAGSTATGGITDQV